MTVAITGRKIHLAIDSTGILSQSLFNYAHSLYELAPVHRPKKSEAGDAVAYRNLVGSLLLVLRLPQLFNCQTTLGKLLLNPGQRHCQRGTLSLQPTRKFRNK